MTFELLPSDTNIRTKKTSCKRGLIGPSGLKSLKIILALLIEVVTIYVWLTKIYIWYLSFKKLFMLHWRLARSLVRLQVSFYELFEQFIRNRQSKSKSGNQSGNQNKNKSGAQSKIIELSKRGTWMKTFSRAWVSSKLIFYIVNRKEVLIRETIRTRISGSHFDKWLDWISD